jgi:hypothetical protein
MSDHPVVYDDDTDASATWELTQEDGEPIDWASPQIAIAGGSYVAASWLDPAGSPRRIQVSMPLGLGLPRGTYKAHLKVPGGNDIQLGWVTVETRA